MPNARSLVAIIAAVASVSLIPAGSLRAADAPAATVAANESIANADKQIATALAYLKSKQNADGSWGAANDPPAISALVLRVFARNEQAKEPFVVKGFEKLLSFQQPNGGIYRDTLATYNTSIAISALVAAKDPALQPRIDAAVAYVRANQFGPTPEGKQPTTAPADAKDAFYGGWGYGTPPANRTERPDLSNAQIALDALHDACIPANDPAYQRAVAFLTRCQNLQSTNDQKWASNDGGFVYGPGADRNGDSEAGEYTDEGGKRMVRSYGSMTYAGLKSMIYAGLTKEDPRVKAAVAWIGNNYTLDKNPGMELASADNAKSGLFYYYHTLARAMAARGEPTLALADGRVVDWRTDLVAKLATEQQFDGSWVGTRRWMEANPILATCYAVQALEETRDELKRTTR